MERLDRVLISNDWENKFPLTSLRKITRAYSYHNPLPFDTHQILERQSGEFRFELSWLKDEKCSDLIANIWKEPVVARDFLDVVTMKLKKVRKK